MVTVGYDGLMVSILIAGDYYAFVDQDINVLGRYNYEPFMPTQEEFLQEFRTILKEYFGDIPQLSKMVEAEINNFIDSEFYKQLPQEEDDLC